MSLHGYECHITIDLADALIGAQVAEELGWKTSEISRDPLLGHATYYYLTTHDYSYLAIFQKMQQAVTLLQARNAKIVREKIEEIVHDCRYADH